ncbi:hypothetical protein ABTH55_18850, partial [Acinetobacter baumannii]
KWLGERDLYDRRDYFHEGITADDIIEQLDAHEAALASPIREPEISKLTKEAIIDAIRENVSVDIHFDLCRVEEAADAILNLAPVGG